MTADCGGSNGYRNRLWKLELQQLANETGLIIEVCHFPPGTSKWNKVEHRLFCHITRNWRGVPLETHEVIVNSQITNLRFLVTSRDDSALVGASPETLRVFQSNNFRILSLRLRTTNPAIANPSNDNDPGSGTAAAKPFTANGIVPMLVAAPVAKLIV